MGDHLVLVVDDVLTDSARGAAIDESSTQLMKVSTSLEEEARRRKAGGPGEKLVECRICQEEDEASNMESPCSCCGSLKYAHRNCVQRWCNEKGDIMCEICLKQFRPGYTAPPQLIENGRISMNYRGNWDVPERDLHYQSYLETGPANSDYIGSDYEYYSASNTRSVWYCRSVAITFTVLLILRHALPLIIGGVENYSATLFTLLLLRTAGIVLPLYIMLRAINTFSGHRRRQETQVLPDSAPSFPDFQPQPHLIRIH